MTSSEEIQIKLGIDQTALGKGLKEAQKGVDQFAKKTRDGFQDIMKELAAPLSAAGIIAGVEKVFGKVEEIERVSAAVGMTAESYQRFAYAAKESGIQGEQAEIALEFLSKTIGEAAEGEEKAQAAFDKWHISVKNSNGAIKDTSEILNDISDLMASMPESSKRSALAMDMFGRSGAKMVDLLGDGANGLHAKGAGAAIFSEADIESIKTAHQTMEEFTNSATIGLGKAIGSLATFFGYFGTASVYAGRGGAQKAADDAANVENLKRLAEIKNLGKERIAARDASEGEEAKALREEAKAVRERQRSGLGPSVSGYTGYGDLGAHHEPLYGAAYKMQQIEEHLAQITDRVFTEGIKVDPQVK